MDGTAYLETANREIACRRYPDVIKGDGTAVLKVPAKSHVTVDCWTNSELQNNLGVVDDSNVWLHLKEPSNCWLHEYSFTNFGDLSGLPFCVAPVHQVVPLQPQYYQFNKCYNGPSIGTTSKDIHIDRYIDVVCTASGEDFSGNKTWVKAAQGCFYPGAVFDNKEWGDMGLPTC